MKPPSLQKGFYKISAVHQSIFLSVCLPVCQWYIFLRIYSVDFLIFDMRIFFALYTKKWQSQIFEDCICCLGNRVNKTKSRIFGILIGSALLFVLQVMPHKWLYDFVTIACLGKIWFSIYRPKCSLPIRLHYFLNFNISKTIRGVKFIFCM